MGFFDSQDQVVTAGPLGDIPLVVLAGEYPPPYPNVPAETLKRVWLETQEQLAALSTQGKFLVIEGGDNYFHLKKPAPLLDELARMISHARLDAP